MTLSAPASKRTVNTRFGHGTGTRLGTWGVIE
jgi:hypothetical protein